MPTPSPRSRSIDRAPEGEHLSRNDIARRMKQVDKNRAQYRQMFADNKWGAKETYHLCVNTSGHETAGLTPAQCLRPLLVRRKVNCFG